MEIYPVNQVLLRFRYYVDVKYGTICNSLYEWYKVITVRDYLEKNIVYFIWEIHLQVQMD